MLAGVFHARDIETFKPSKMKTAAEEIRESIAELEKRHNQTQSALEETAKKIEELKKEALKLTEPERIRVPENIKFEGYLDRLALISPNGKCILAGKGFHGGIPRVGMAGQSDNLAAHIITDPLYLEPCKREDLKCGDVAFCCEGIHIVTSLSSNIAFYVCILNKNDHVFWNEGMDIRVSDMYWSDWYKVVR